jgi:Ferritin-like
MLLRAALSADPIANLQRALAIELAVLPPYLYACWSVKPRAAGASAAAAEASRTIRSVLYQEMLHVATAANVLNALGAKPHVTASLMKYPGNLPWHVTDGPYAYTVGLCALSAAALDTFKKIERPEWDVTGAAGPSGDWITIGAFYEAIKDQLKALPDSAFAHGRQLALRDNPAPGRLYQVKNRTSAFRAIDTIVVQGEGHKPGNASPQQDDSAHETAHYYQFDTIRRYFDTPLLDPARDLYPIIDNPDAAVFNGAQQQLNFAFNQLYCELLDTLEAAFASPAPQVFGAATRLMRRLELAAAMLRNAGVVPGSDRLAGPTFDYVAAGAPGV